MVKKKEDSASKCLKVLLGETMHPHQVDVCVLFALEVFVAEVTVAVTVELHVGVILIFLGERFPARFFVALEIGTVFSC